MIIKQSDIKIIKRIIAQCKISQKHFSDIARISERTLRSALKGKNISKKTWNGIYNATISIKLKYEINKLEVDLAEKHEVEARNTFVSYTAVLNFSLFCVAILGTLLLLNWLLR